MTAPKTKFIHFGTLHSLLFSHSTYTADGKMVRFTEEDRGSIAKETVNHLFPDEVTFVGFIFLDSMQLQQRSDFEKSVRPALEKQGVKFELVHQSPYFCNRGYNYGNVLQFALFKVTRNVV